MIEVSSALTPQQPCDLQQVCNRNSAVSVPSYLSNFLIIHSDTVCESTGEGKVPCKGRVLAFVPLTFNLFLLPQKCPLHGDLNQ